MSRGDGFSVADTDTGMLSDPKVVALARRLRDSAKTMTAVGLYDAVRLGSWGCGRRLTIEEALPGWWLDPIDEWVEHLVAVGLLDDEHRLPDHAWTGWYGPAFDRRQRYRDLGSKGGLAAHREPVERTVERTVEPVRTVPSVPTDPGIPTVARVARVDDPGSNRTTTNEAKDRLTSVGSIVASLVPSEGPCRICGGYLSDKDPCKVGPGWIEHADHPPEWSAAS